MEVSVLASGSSGNSTYVESKDAAILIDAGISTKELAKRLSAIGKEISDIDAAFITHEHIDHIRGAQRLSDRFDMPLFLTEPTLRNSALKIEDPSIFEPSSDIHLKDLIITPFSISHDAADPCAFRVNDNASVFGIMTDFGKSNTMIERVISESDMLVIESNHDLDMLRNGPYPYHLKQRILGDKGHMSNIDTGMLVKNHASEKLKNVILAHLSKINNREELADSTFAALSNKNPYLRKTNKIIAKQEENTELIKT